MTISEKGRFGSAEKNIETARTPEEAIIIITEEECRIALKRLRVIFAETFPNPHEVSVVPILRSGLRLARDLTDPIGLKLNPMRMTYYREDTSRLPSPICLTPPDMSRILTHEGKTKPVIFTECVVESQGTVLAAIKEINDRINIINTQEDGKFDYPEYHTFAYVTKTGDHPVLIPNLVAGFAVHQDVWVGGLGCDLPGDKGRDLAYLVGILSPFATEIPSQPYYLPMPTFCE